MINEYFSRSHTKWSLKDFLIDFLSLARDHEKTLNTLTTAWISSLDAIRHDGEADESRSRKAHFLREQWDQVCKYASSRDATSLLQVLSCFGCDFVSLVFVRERRGLP